MRVITVAFLALLSGVCRAQEGGLALPTPQQAAWHDLELGVFTHFAPNTRQDREYDDLSTPLEEIAASSRSGSRRSN